jgi:hypothetical protein
MLYMPMSLSHTQICEYRGCGAGGGPSSGTTCTGAVGVIVGVESVGTVLGPGVLVGALGAGVLVGVGVEV